MITVRNFDCDGNPIEDLSKITINLNDPEWHTLRDVVQDIMRNKKSNERGKTA